MNKRTILVLGSGPIRIGQAAEFDYSGSQACRALKDEKCRVILLNSNPATIQTDTLLADVIYIRPLEPEVVEAIVAEHRPDGVIATLGGQTALNLCIECEDLGIWDKYETEVLGTSVESIRRAEGREEFRQTMLRIGQPVVPSTCVSTVEEALSFAEETPFPLIIRPDFTLGGTGGGVASDVEELRERVAEGLRASPVDRVLVERYLRGWREFEAEVVRDSRGNSLCVCSMENVDPMGVHTGDSVVVSPELTLTDGQWQRIRSVALAIVDALDVRGACNAQFALSPNGEEYAVIEVNPRASRSSALASKATGYPIARIAAKIALGKTLTELPNPVTGVGSALAEPALDYVVVKVPRWPFDAFPQIDSTLGTRMKATGEVMALGLAFPQALLKAFRSLDGTDRLFDGTVSDMTEECLWNEVLAPTHRRIECIFELLRRGISSEEIARRSSIHLYFIAQMMRVVEVERKFAEEELSAEALSEAKFLGMTDETIAALAGASSREVVELRGISGLEPSYREVDGCAGEVPAGSGYYYGAWGSVGEVRPDDVRKSVAVLGSGAIRIAQGVEFDYCCVKAVESLRRRGYRAVMINNNPETVSTDHDISDALYLEPLAAEDVLAVLEREAAQGVLAGFGGQTSLKLGQILNGRKVRLLGTSSDTIDAAEDRGRFVELLERLEIPHPAGGAVSTEAGALDMAEKMGFPLMVRPSFVIGGVAMYTVTRREDFLEVVRQALAVDPGQEILIDRFLSGKEFEVDAVCDGKDVLIPGIFEHLDPAGVHSGDSIAVFPDVSLGGRLCSEVLEIVQKLSASLDVKGLLNVQFVLHQGIPYVIEANPRASRTIPIVSKLSGVPMIDLAVGVALGERLKDLWPEMGLASYRGPFGVKTPVFSTEKLPGLDSRVGPQMQSTGESLGIHGTLSGALEESLRGAGWHLPKKGKILFSIRDDRKSDACSVASTFLALGWKLEATPGTAEMFSRWGLPVSAVEKDEALLEGLRRGRWQLVVNLPGALAGTLRDGYAIRRTAIEEGVPCLHTLEAASAVAASLVSGRRVH